MLELVGLKKSFGSTKVLQDIQINIEEGCFYCLLGPSGCGKTTLLRCLAGLEKLDSGEMRHDGKELGPLPSHKRGLSLVFQNYALWPHLNLAENIVYGLRVQKQTEHQIEIKLKQLLQTYRLEGLEKRFPNELSGGQQQRVALARAMAIDPKIILMDEPLSNLDANLRKALRRELKEFHRQSGTTVIYVTHDQEEALALGDQIGLMLNGVLVASGKPESLYDRPPNLATAQFLGEMNCLSLGLEVEPRNSSSQQLGSLFTAIESGRSLCIRPEHLTLASAEKDFSVEKDFQQSVVLKGQIEAIEFLGSHSTYLVVSGAAKFQVRLNHKERNSQSHSQSIYSKIGDSVFLSLKLDQCHFYPEN